MAASISPTHPTWEPELSAVPGRSCPVVSSVAEAPTKSLPGQLSFCPIPQLAELRTYWNGLAISALHADYELSNLKLATALHSIAG